MEPLTAGYRFGLCIAFVVLAAVSCVGNLWRSTTLKKGFSEATMKMYVAFIVVPVVAAAGVAGAMSLDAFAGLLGIVVGYALGNKPWKEDDVSG